MLTYIRNRAFPVDCLSRVRGAPLDKMKGNDMDSPIFRIRLQKRTIYVLLVAMTLAIGVIVILRVFPQERRAPVSSPMVVGRQAPDFTLATLDEMEVSLSQFQGQPVLINFWSTWCAPCRQEMPELVRAYEAHKGEGFVVLGLNLAYSDFLTDVKSFASEFNMTFPVLLDKDGAVAEGLYRIPGLPTSVFVNRDGTIERIQVGVMTGQQIDQYISEILSSKIWKGENRHEYN